MQGQVQRASHFTLQPHAQQRRWRSSASAATIQHLSASKSCESVPSCTGAGRYRNLLQKCTPQSIRGNKQQMLQCCVNLRASPTQYAALFLPAVTQSAHCTSVAAAVQPTGEDIRCYHGGRLARKLPQTAPPPKPSLSKLLRHTVVCKHAHA